MPFSRTLLACAAALLCGLIPAAPARAGGLAPLRAPEQLKVVSYYPADAGWTQMWERWNPARVDADFARIASLHANTVRVIVQTNLFGFPQPQPVYLDRLRQLFDIAAAHDLHVQLTLFDWWWAYGDVRGSKQWARAVLGPYVGDPRLATVELRNEVNPREQQVVRWVRPMLPFLQRLLRHATPVTVSVPSHRCVRALGVLKRELAPARPDFYDIHYYGAGDDAAQIFAAAKAIAAPQPLWVGETGYPTSDVWTQFGGVPMTFPAQEAAQVQFFAATAAAAAQNGLPPIGVWILDDFAPGAIPTPNPTKDPPPHEPEYHFGLFRVDGSAKPAAASVAGYFQGAGMPVTFNAGFEAGVDAGKGRIVPAAWAAHEDKSVDLVQDRTVARTGFASARIASFGGAEASGSFSVEPVDVLSGRGGVARAGAWARGGDVTGSVRVAIAWYSVTKKPVGAVFSPALPRGDTGWTRLVAAGVVPRRAAYAVVYLQSLESTGVAWFDDVEYEHLP